ncbi:MAG: helix-turn-helix domain-containing protein [Kiritimatiellae bacterium]|nr:helix-turn-helix domain-containing protein [Kiritimatiellia bacterium]
MARQMTQDDRRRIDALLAAGRTPVEIAADLDRNKPTLLHEIIARAVPCNKGYGCTAILILAKGLCAAEARGNSASRGGRFRGRGG